MTIGTIHTQTYSHSFINAYTGRDTVSTQYWGGVPLGRMGGNTNDLEPRFDGTYPNDVYFYNHYKLKVFFHQLGETKVQIIRTIVEPYSINYNDPESLALQCGDPDQSGMVHLSYRRLENVTAQPATGVLRMTYDIQWVETEKPFATRWNVYLSMNGAVPGWIEFLNCLLGGLILTFIGGSLYTWVMRDLSYKPVFECVDVSEKEAAEIQMWPFSTRIFFPPIRAPILLCILCGIGAHLLVTGFCFALFFRFGIINASQGKKMITSGLILYCGSGAVGGYVTGRLYSIFHGERVIALAASLVTALAYPLLGMITVVFVYDVLPGADVPQHNVMGNITPLLLVWICTTWPLTVAGAYLGHRHGPIHHFPVSSGTQGYQDLNLQDNDNRENDEELIEGRWFVFVRKWRITIAFLFGGLLPVFSSFISYSYAIAAPVLIGSYPVRSYMVTSFLLFNMVAAAGAVLAYYRQIRTHLFHWWWSTFAAASSAGLYIFLLSLSYMIFKAESHVQFRTLFGYTLWFGFLSLGVAMMTGFSGIALCIVFNRTMYSILMQRNE
jgi:transmembrane 9 superfamily member 2/4